VTELHDAVDRVPREELIPYTNNPKEHPDEQVKKIASSIKNYGWDQPIVVDSDGEIIKGHGRMQAAERLGLDTVPVIRRDDLTDAEAKAARIADNKTAESAWDDDLLATEIETIPEFDAETLGFDESELDELLEPADMDVPDEFDEVDDEEIETEHKCPECGYEW
jgi:ParB-like chromosome segregation protein Spo0J